MRDTRESRLLLVLLIAIAFALITVDIRGGEDSPVGGARRVAATAFGPVENTVSAGVDPIGDAIGAVRDSGAANDRIGALERENAGLKARLGSDARNRSRVAQLDGLLKTAGAGQYAIKGAQVIAIGAAQGFSWTATIDAGSGDGIKRDMTVLNAEGLVGRVTTVGPSTSTVLLASDPDFTVGTRLESSDELGFASGGGNGPLRVQLLNSKTDVKKGDRMVTFGSQAGKPFVPGVPVGRVSKVDPASGDLTRTVHVDPYVGFSRLDVVGVVVTAPREDPRDTVLPPKPKTDQDKKQDKKKGDKPQEEPGNGLPEEGQADPDAPADPGDDPALVPGREAEPEGGQAGAQDDDAQPQDQ